MSEKFTLEWNEELPAEIAVGDTLDYYGSVYAVLAINEDGIVVKQLELPK